MTRACVIRSRLLETARRQALILGFDRLSARAICAEAGVSLEELYELYPGGLEELKAAMLASELDHTVVVPWLRGTFFDDLVELSRGCHDAISRNRVFFLASLSAIYLSRPLGRLLSDKLCRAFLLLTRSLAAYRREEAWNGRYDQPLVEELSDRLAVSFIAGILTRELLSAFGLARDRFDPEEHVTEWLYGVARSSWPPVQAAASSPALSWREPSSLSRIETAAA